MNVTATGKNNFQSRASEHVRYFFLCRRLKKKVNTAASASERERADMEVFVLYQDPESAVHSFLIITFSFSTVKDPFFRQPQEAGCLKFLTVGHKYLKK